MKQCTTPDVFSHLRFLAGKFGKRNASKSDECLKAVNQLEAGNPDLAIEILMERRRRCRFSANAHHPNEREEDTRIVVDRLWDEVNLIGFLLDRLAEEYNPKRVWVDGGAQREQELKVLRANEAVVTAYFRSQAERVNDDPTIARDTYQTAAAQLEAGNHEPASLLLRNELHNCDSNSRLRELEAKLRQMLGFLGEIYGHANVRGNSEIGRALDATLDGSYGVHIPAS